MATPAAAAAATPLDEAKARKVLRQVRDLTPSPIRAVPSPNFYHF